jgi:hypothetical protein
MIQLRLSVVLWSLLIAGALPMLAGQTPDSGSGGLLLILDADSEGCRLVSAATIERFHQPHQQPSRDDWQVQLRAADGSAVWQSSIGNPWRGGHQLLPGSGRPFNVKVPDLPAATGLVLLDHAGQIQLQIRLDEPLRSMADAERQRFLELDRSNRAHLTERLARKSTAGAEKAPRSPLSRFERLDETVQRSLVNRAAREAELLARLDRPRISNHQLLDRADLAAYRQQVAEQRRRQSQRSGKTAKTGEYILSGSIRDAETGEPVAQAYLSFTQYSMQYQYIGVIGSVFTDQAGHYSVTADHGYVLARITATPGQRYTSQAVWQVVRGDSRLDIAAVPAVTITGSVLDHSGNPVGASVEAAGGSFYGSVMTAGDSGYSIIVPRDQQVTLSVTPVSPYAAPEPIDLRLSADGEQHFSVEPGHLLSGSVTDRSGTALSGATVLLRHLGQPGGSVTMWPAVSDWNGVYRCVVPRHLRPTSHLLSVHLDGYVRHASGLVINGDLDYNVTLDEGISVTGSVRDEIDNPLAEVMVRVYQEDLFVSSAETVEDGSYAVALQPGSYTFKATPLSAWEPSLLAPVEVAGVEVAAPLTLDLVLPAAEARVTLKLRYPDQAAAQLCQGIARVEARRDGRPCHVTYDDNGPFYLDEVSGRYIREIDLFLETGTYDLQVYPMGGDPFLVAAVEVTGDTTVTHDLADPYTWSGVLRTADGSPLPETSIVVYDDLSTALVASETDADGSFTIPLAPNGTVKFYSPEQGYAIRRIVLLDEEVSSRQQDCILDSFPEVADSGGTVTRIWGDGEPDERYNLVVIGDGYTDINETFTDLNGNQVWDGVLYYDVNGNGLYDGLPERYTVYGEATAPQVGTDPTVNNEPFEDSNGDGFLNYDEQQLYDENARGLIRALFGADVWQEHRDVFNVYRIRVVSAQAGHDILDEEGYTVHERDTALGTFIHSPSRRYALAPDRGLVQQLVNQYTPFADTIIVIINQPVTIGRATSYIITRGGRANLTANQFAMSHEMGHNLALLADEYTEFTETYEGPELVEPNITTFSERELIPWRELIAPDQEIPSLPLTTGVGLYEGAYYQPAGVYRPAQTCIMSVRCERFCPVCRQQIISRISRISNEVLDGVELLSPLGPTPKVRPSFRWRGPQASTHYQLQLRTAGSTDELLDIDVAAASHRLGYDLEPGTSYEWRVRPGVWHHWGVWTGWASFSLAEPSPTGVAAGVAAAAGLAGSDWHSDLWLHNAGSETAAVRLYLMLRDQPLAVDSAQDLTVAAGATVALRDLVATLFDTSGSGAVAWQVLSGQAQQVLVEGRTYNRVSESASYGHAVFGQRWDQAAAAGASLIVPVASGESFRTNIDFTTDSQCSQVRLRIRDAGGQVVVEQTIGTGPSRWQQIIDLVAELGLDSGSAYQAELTGIDGRILAGNSLIDNASNDASRMLAETAAAGDQTLWLPGAALVAGAGSSDWHSDLILIDTSGSAQPCSLVFVPRDATWEARLVQELSLAGTAVEELQDVLAGTFQLASGSAGSLAVSATAGAPLAFMRTYSKAGAGLTFGQYIPAWSDEETISDDLEGRIIGLGHGPGVRSNLLLQSTYRSSDGTYLPVTVRVELLAADGSVVGSGSWPLAPAQNRQLNGIVETLLGSGAELHDFVVRLTVEAAQDGGLGGVIAAASEVNGNSVPGTNDPRLVRAQLVDP